MNANIKILFFVSIIGISCTTFPGKRAISDVYTNPNNCGFFQFYRDGSFRFDTGEFSKEKCLNAKLLPEPSRGEVGRYSFSEKSSLTPSLFIQSEKINQFEIHFSEDLKSLQLKNKKSNADEVFYKIK